MSPDTITDMYDATFTCDLATMAAVTTAALDPANVIRRKKVSYMHTVLLVRMPEGMTSFEPYHVVDLVDSTEGGVHVYNCESEDDARAVFNELIDY